ncbi:MAG: TIGR03936 family radical SAM-associated protein [Clostridiales bacterium]|jgi:radical SAM-linked protein|nr:TIGR03936 family radical SAM-associated protein [Clostridiales bacterium]
MSIYRLIFSKTGSICLVGHLDFVQSFRRAIKRAKLPVAYSAGFNPHMEFAVSQPLPLAMEGYNEFAEMSLYQEIPPEEVATRLNNCVCDGVFIKSVCKLEKNEKSAAAHICRAVYTANITSETADEILKSSQEILGSTEIKIMKKTKSGEKLTDIRPDIFRITVKDMQLVAEISSGSKANLNPAVLAEVLSCGKNLKFNREKLILDYDL